MGGTRGGWAVDADGRVRESESRGFTVDATPPSDFALAAPADGAVVADARPTLEWQPAADFGSGLDRYEVWIDGALAGTTEGTSFTPADPQPAGAHGWHVVALDRAGNARASASWTYVVDLAPPAGSYEEAILAIPDLRGYWRLGSAEDGVSPASFGPSDCTLSGGPAVSEPGALAADTDGAMTFDGSGDYAFCGDPSEFRLATGTMEVWLRTSAPGSGRRLVFGKPAAWAIELVDGILTVRDAKAVVSRSTGRDVADDAWHHVAVAFQWGVSGGTSVYLDGELVLTSTIAGTSQKYPVQIAANNASSGVKDFFAGTVDEAALYGTLLTAAQIAEHHRLGTP